MPLYGAPICIPVFYYRVGRRRLYPLLRMGWVFVAESGQNGQITQGAGLPSVTLRNSRPGRDPDIASRGSEYLLLIIKV